MTDPKTAAAPFDQAARRLNADIGRAYDEVLYDLNVGAAMHPAVVLGQGALYGCLPDCGDVLDLGCGTGRMLEAAGDFMSGRLVGVDLSADSLRLARERCARFGDRADIRQADILDLRAEELGGFDLIYAVGVFYIAPAEVRRKMLELIGRCLRPGGVLVISHYAGTSAHLRASLARLLRALDDPTRSAEQRIAAGRAHIAALLADIDDADVNGPMLKTTLSLMSKTKDPAFFHEVYGQIFDVIDTHEMAATLAPCGLSYLTGHRLEPWAAMPDAGARVGAAARRDLLKGGYQYALFGKLPDGARGIDVTRPQLRWVSNMTVSETEDGGRTLLQAGRPVRISLPWVQAALESIGPSGEPWWRLRDTALAAAGDQEPRDQLLAQFERDMIAAWVVSAVLPLRWNLPYGN